MNFFSLKKITKRIKKFVAKLEILDFKTNKYDKLIDIFLLDSL